MERFGKVGCLASSQMHSDHDSAESIADSDRADGELRKMLTSPLYVHGREDCESSRISTAPGKLAALIQERGVSAKRTQADRREGLMSNSSQETRALEKPAAMFSIFKNAYPSKPKVIYTDNSLEFGKACEELPWNHYTSTPHRSKTNGIAERAVRRVKEGTSAVLLQSGLGNEWWADSIECYCYLRNIQDLLSDGKSPYERQFGMPFDGPVIPFGAMVECHLISAKDISRLHQFCPKVLPGIFFGCVLYAGRVWKGDIMVADIEELEEMDASEIHAKKAQCKGSVNDNEW